jgi:hypothetical protein
VAQAEPVEGLLVGVASVVDMTQQAIPVEVVVDLPVAVCSGGDLVALV